MLTEGERMPSDAEPYRLVLPFDTDDPEFVRGVEVGMLHQRLCSERLPITATIHASNVEMALRLAEAHSASASADELGSDFLSVNYR
jgi:hypothetical protein